MIYFFLLPLAWTREKGIWAFLSHPTHVYVLALSVIYEKGSRQQHGLQEPNLLYKNLLMHEVLKIDSAFKITDTNFKVQNFKYFITPKYYSHIKLRIAF